jgi:hypothetical protein
MRGFDMCESPGINAVKCLNCGKVMESKSVHDFRMCNCPNETFVDGGTDYQRYGGHRMELIAAYRNGRYVNVVTEEDA